MSTRILSALRAVATIAGIASCLVVQTGRRSDDHRSMELGKPRRRLPPLKAVMIDKSTTVLLMLDFNEQTCMQRRPRCVESIPKAKNC